MKVKDLKEALALCSPESEVVIPHEFGGFAQLLDGVKRYKDVKGNWVVGIWFDRHTPTIDLSKEGV